MTDSEGGAPGEHFSDLVMVPGDTNTSSIRIAQDTGDPVRAGARFESLTELHVLHEAVELTVEGMGTAVTMSLEEAMDRDSPVWLGDLPSGQEAEVTLTAHLPYETGNEAKRTEASFRVIIAAHQPLTHDPGAPEDLPPGEGPGTEDGIEDWQEGPPEDEDLPPESEAAPAQDQLPETGTAVLLLVVLAVALMIAGTLTRRAARRIKQ